MRVSYLLQVVVVAVEQLDASFLLFIYRDGLPKNSFLAEKFLLGL